MFKNYYYYFLPLHVFFFFFWSDEISPFSKSALASFPTFLSLPMPCSSEIPPLLPDKILAITEKSPSTHPLSEVSSDHPREATSFFLCPASRPRMLCPVLSCFWVGFSFLYATINPWGTRATLSLESWVFLGSAAGSFQSVSDAWVKVRVHATIPPLLSSTFSLFLAFYLSQDVCPWDADEL